MDKSKKCGFICFGQFTGDHPSRRIKREHWRIEVRIYAWIAKPLRFLGVDLNWVFDPITQWKRRAQRKAAPARPAGVEQNRREE